MQIQIVTTSVETKPTAKGSYQQLEVVYKNLTYQGKVESKKVMSFGAGASSFKALSDASGGSVWEITVVKNAAGYNDWTAATPSDGSAPAAAPTGSTVVSTSKASVTPRSTYETPEERAQRQILIVRQSSVSAAVASLTPGAKTAIPVETIIKVAKSLEAYVFGVKDPGPTGFDDVPSVDFDSEVQ